MELYQQFWRHNDRVNQENYADTRQNVRKMGENGITVLGFLHPFFING